jgi:hypothetical protein
MRFTALASVTSASSSILIFRKLSLFLLGGHHFRNGAWQTHANANQRLPAVAALRLWQGTRLFGRQFHKCQEASLRLCGLPSPYCLDQLLRSVQALSTNLQQNVHKLRNGNWMKVPGCCSQTTRSFLQSEPAGWDRLFQRMNCILESSLICKLFETVSADNWSIFLGN